MFDPFFIDEFFIFRLKSVICKKYTNTDGKDCKYTKAIDISIIRSCGGGVISVGRRNGGRGVGGGSFIACIGSISATFFSSFRILSFNLFMYFSLPLRPASTRFASFVIFF